MYMKLYERASESAKLKFIISQLCLYFHEKFKQVYNTVLFVLCDNMRQMLLLHCKKT